MISPVSASSIYIQTVLEESLIRVFVDLLRIPFLEYFSLTFFALFPTLPLYYFAKFLAKFPKFSAFHRQFFNTENFSIFSFLDSLLLE